METRRLLQTQSVDFGNAQSGGSRYLWVLTHSLHNEHNLVYCATLRDGGTVKIVRKKFADLQFRGVLLILSTDLWTNFLLNVESLKGGPISYSRKTKPCVFLSTKECEPPSR